jgi:hypothetical protein
MTTKQLYRVQPTEHNAIDAYYNVVSINEQNQVRGWSVTETYEWGHAFRELTNPVTAWEVENAIVHCDPDTGFGAYLAGVVESYFKFDDSFSDLDREEIKLSWATGGVGWLNNNNQIWSITESSIRMQTATVDLVDEACVIIEENIKLV